MAPWSVYIVRCADGTLYTGIATDVPRRIAEHARGDGRGAKYLRGRGPLRLAFVKVLGSRSQALRIERRIKTLPKARKETLIAEGAEGRLGVRLRGVRQAGVHSHRGRVDRAHGAVCHSLREGQARRCRTRGEGPSP